MTDHLNLIRIKLQHLSRMREYLACSLAKVESVLILKDWRSPPNVAFATGVTGQNVDYVKMQAKDTTGVGHSSGTRALLERRKCSP